MSKQIKPELKELAVLTFDINNFGKECKKVRKTKGYTQAQVYEKIGISEETLRLLENGKRFPTTKLIVILSTIYETNLFEIMAKHQYPPKINSIKEIILKNL